jgi:hypothetical protein
MDRDLRLVRATVEADSVKEAPEFATGAEFPHAYETSSYKRYRCDPYWQ